MIIECTHKPSDIETHHKSLIAKESGCRYGLAVGYDDYEECCDCYCPCDELKEASEMIWPSR